MTDRYGQIYIIGGINGGVGVSLFSSIEGYGGFYKPPGPEVMARNLSGKGIGFAGEAVWGLGLGVPFNFNRGTTFHEFSYGFQAGIGMEIVEGVQLSPPNEDLAWDWLNGDSMQYFRSKYSRYQVGELLPSENSCSCTR